MFKILIDPVLFSGLANRSAFSLSLFKKINGLPTAFCVRSITEKQSKPYKNYGKMEVDDEGSYRPQTDMKRDSKTAYKWKNNRNSYGWDKHARQTYDYNDEHGDDEPSEPDSDTFGGGIGRFHEITSTGHPPDNVKRKARKKNYLPENWSQEFGTLGGVDEDLLAKDDEGSDLEDDAEEDKILKHVRLSRYNRRHIPNWYARRIQKYGKRGEIRKAIEVFDEWMIKRDRVKPTNFEYTVLMKLLADVGYTKKTFQLYRDMTVRKIYVDDHVFTCLFNACANSPWPLNGLKYAKQLRQKMLYRDIKPSYITYLAMIKAFGFCGDINTAFSIADEAAMIRVDDQLLNNLLTACISDKDAGFRHAILVWRKFRKLGVQPDLKSYNLLLRCVNECGVGDPDLLKRLFNQTNLYAGNLPDSRTGDSVRHLEDNTDMIPLEKNDFSRGSFDHIRNQKAPLNEKLWRTMLKSFSELDQFMARHGFDSESVEHLKESNDEITDLDGQVKLESVAIDDNKEWWEQDIFENSLSLAPVQNTETTLMKLTDDTFPNILDPKEDIKFLVDVKALKWKQERLDLLGGMHGVLQTLESNNIKPDIVTFSLLSKSVRPDSLDYLISKMWAVGVKPDIVFYNHCIETYARGKPHIAWALYKQLKTEELVPDVRTYSILALACRRLDEGLKLIDDMLEADLMPNAFTITALLQASNLNFNYKTVILRKMTELSIQCTEDVIKIIERDIQVARSKLFKQERMESIQKHLSDEELKQIQNTERLRKSLNNFMRFYDKWLKKQHIPQPPHPWKAFKPEIDKTES